MAGEQIVDGVWQPGAVMADDDERGSRPLYRNAHVSLPDQFASDPHV
jgi:hypothetical protein